MATPAAPPQGAAELPAAALRPRLHRAGARRTVRRRGAAGRDRQAGGRQAEDDLSAEKTPVTHIDDGLDFLGFHIQGKSRGDGRHVVLTYPSKQALAAVRAKIKQATGRGTTSTRLREVLRVVNPVLRGWAAYFRYGVSKRTFAYLGYYAWWRLLAWIRRKHPHLTWKQLRRRYFGTDRICEDGLVLYNPAKMRVQRYRFRGAQIATRYNVD